VLAMWPFIAAVGEVGGDETTTLDGPGTPEHPRPIKQALIDERAANCGYSSSPAPTDEACS